MLPRNFEALGREAPAYKSPFYITLAASLSAFLFILFFPLLGGKINPALFQDAFANSYIAEGWPLSLGILLVTLVALAVYWRLRYNRMHRYNIKIVDEKEKGGGLSLEYMALDDEDSFAKSMTLRAMKIRPREPLPAGGTYVDFGVAGTRCSIIMYSKKYT